MTKCGICNCHSSSSNPLLCSSCVNFQLLKPKLEYLDLIQELSSSKSLVDHVLDKCIKGNNYPFIKEYIQNNNTADKNEDSVSLGSIAALSSQLLTIDAILLKRKNNKIMKEISILQSKKDSNILRLESLKGKLSDRKAQLNHNTTSDPIKPIQSQTALIRQDSTNILKQINNSQSILFQELINLQLIKKRKLSGTQQHIFMISFIPMLSIHNLTQFNNEIINASLERMSKFIHQISQIWMINLPYQIEFDKKTVYRPKILGFEMSLPQGKQVWELSTFELKMSLNGVSRLVVDIYTVLGFFQIDDMEPITNYFDLFSMDEMVYKIVNNNYKMTFKRDNEEIRYDDRFEKLDIDELTDRIFEYIMEKINQKNNEWHVVEKEFLIHDEE